MHKALKFEKYPFDRESHRMTTPIASINSITNRDYLLEFVSRFEQLSGKTYRCSAGNEASMLIQKLIAGKGEGKCYFTKEVLAFIQSKDNSGQHSISSAELYDPKENTNGLDILKEADIGITTANFAVAETGCLVEVSYEDSTKLLSSLSRVNIVLLRASNILSTLQELAPILRGLLSKKDKPTITLISGPSRTSDIEMKSVLGVHGPHEVYAIIVE